MAPVPLDMSLRAHHGGRELSRVSVCKIHDLPGNSRTLVEWLVLASLEKPERAGSRSKKCIRECLELAE